MYMYVCVCVCGVCIIYIYICMHLFCLLLPFPTRTAAANWMGKSRLAALKQALIDEHTNSQAPAAPMAPRVLYTERI